MKSKEQVQPEITDVMLSPLRSFEISGRRAALVADEPVFAFDPDVDRLQAFPGQRLPDPGTRVRFPVPDKVGEYCTWDEFQSSPKFMAQFVHWPDRVNSVLEGRYQDVVPVHFEGIFTLVCNFMCPHCSRRVTRTKWVEGGAWENNTPVEKKNTMHPAGLRRVIDQLAENMVDSQMGIIWGGGDPTANPFTYDGMLYAKSLGITASFLTNGVFLEVDHVLEADPILVRISLNCGTEEAYRKFHGYPDGWDYFDRVRKKMRELAKAKVETKARTLIGISLIVDERNMNDLTEAAREIEAVVQHAGGGIDYVIVRPVMNYKHFEREHARLKTDTKQRALDLVLPGGDVYEILKRNNVPLVLIKDSFEAPPADDFYYENTDCLAYGIAGEIRHNGDVQLCSDSYGNPDYTIGNLFETTLKDIWTSDRRKSVLSRINEKQCFKTTCPHNSRGHHYNRLFHQIESKRRDGKMDDVVAWIQALRETTYPLHHSFFL